MWLKNEIQFLIDNYVEFGVKKCSRLLNRTENSIKHKAKFLNLNLKSKNYNKKEFTIIVKKSRSFSDVVRKIGLNDGHGNRKTVKKYITKYNIDISHFDFKGEYTKRKNKIELCDILIEKSSYSNNGRIKEKLYKKGLKERICEKCGQDEIWYGEKMSLILDHINGVHNDNRIENLQIVCSNCNATLSTHGGKNTKYIYIQNRKIKISRM